MGKESVSMHYSKESYVNEQLENRSSVESENESETLLPWTPVKKQTPFRWLYWLLLGLSYIFVAGLTYGLVKLEGSQPATEDEHISPWMASIDRSFHHEVGNAAESISPNPNDPDAGNESWNNFTVSAEIGGSEIENWWLDLGSYTKPILVPEEYASDFNFSPTKHAIVSPSDPEYPPGTVPYRGYPASIEVMHKLHCLNILRQATYYNHQYYRNVHGKPWALPEHDLQQHIGHCIDIFRQHILCESEIELVPFLNDDVEHRRNDWSRPKKCRNFESVRSWLHEHQWNAGDPDFYLDDEHPKVQEVVTRKTKHSWAELWRGY